MTIVTPTLDVGIGGAFVAVAGGGLIGSLLHELSHLLAAAAVGRVDGIGWQGGLLGGPFVDYRVETVGESLIVRQAPVALALIGGAVLVAIGPRLSWPWLVAVGALAGLLKGSAEDRSLTAAVESRAGGD